MSVIKNIVVQREIIANGGPDIGVAGSSVNFSSYNKIYDLWNAKDITKKKRKKLLRVYGKGEVTSNTLEPYEDYYGGGYDKNIK